MISTLGRLLPEVRGALARGMTPAEIWDDGRAMLRARWLLRHATSVGERVRVWGRPVIRNSGSVIIGDRSYLISSTIPIQLTAEHGGKLEIGARTGINYGCSILATGLIRIGRGSKIGMHVIMMDNDYHHIDPVRRGIRPAARPIILEENVWIGARAIVLGGVTIGSGSVIGAGSVVTRDVPPLSVAAGQPARVIKSIS